MSIIRHRHINRTTKSKIIKKKKFTIIRMKESQKTLYLIVMIMV